MKLKIRRGSVANYTTDKRAKNDPKEKQRLNLVTIKTICSIGVYVAHPTNPVEGCADANPKTELPNDT